MRNEVVKRCPINVNGLSIYADLNVFPFGSYDVFPKDMNGFSTCGDLKVLPLGFYDVLIGMDWLQ